MSKNKLLIVGAILLSVIVFWSIFKNTSGKNNLTVNPKESEVETVQTTPSPTPKTFKFDNSTDLEAELETIDPQILDSDFE